VQPYLAAGLLKVLPFDLGVSMDSFGIVTRKRHQLSPGADAMLRAARMAASIYPHYRRPDEGSDTGSSDIRTWYARTK
jgi:DNA-binding transcriptional LysR family regulator